MNTPEPDAWGVTKFDNQPGDDHVTWYVTKYALSDGVIVWDGPYTLTRSGSGKRFYVGFTKDRTVYSFTVDVDAFKDPQLAAQHIRRLAVRRLQSLAKQRSALEAIDPEALVLQGREKAGLVNL